MKKCKINPILEKARKAGRNGDTILAHINPLEAIMLKKAGGSGTINPKTGLPEFGVFDFSKMFERIRPQLDEVRRKRLEQQTVLEKFADDRAIQKDLNIDTSPGVKFNVPNDKNFNTSEFFDYGDFSDRLPSNSWVPVDNGGMSSLSKHLTATKNKGRFGDNMLAHITPAQALLLKKLGGSATVNPKTGLSEFWPKGGFLGNPLKALKGSLGGATGAIIGNMILPGIGGIIGGAIGGATGSKIRGRKDYLGAGLRGAGMGAMLPSAASGLGSLTGSKFLTNYGNTNAILPSIGLGEKTANAVQGGSSASALPTLASSNDRSEYEDLENYLDHLKSGKKANKDADLSFMDKLKKNSENFLTKPKNLLALGTTGLSLYDRMNQPKPLTPAQKGRAAKEEMLAARLTPAEMAEQERYELALEHSRRRNARKKFLPEERIDIQPLYNRVSTPEEYAQSGRWINYYDNPSFSGKPVKF